MVVAISRNMRNFRLVIRCSTYNDPLALDVAITEAILAATATLIGKCNSKTITGTMNTPPPTPSSAPKNPAKQAAPSNASTKCSQYCMGSGFYRTRPLVISTVVLGAEQHIFALEHFHREE